MEWCEANGIFYTFGLAGNAVPDSDPAIETVADATCVARPEQNLRCAAMPRPAMPPNPGSLNAVSARIEASTLGLDVRIVVTDLKEGGAEHQAAQGAARLRQNIVPLGHCQPDAL